MKTKKLDIMDTNLSRRHKIKVGLNNAGKIAALIFFLIIIAMLFRNLITSKLSRSDLLTDAIMRADMEASITSSGIVLPEFEQLITSPIYSRIDTTFFKAGEKVTKGSPILSLNKELIQNNYEMLLDEYELKKNRKKQLQIKNERDLINLNTSFEIKKLKIESFAAKLEQEQRLNKIGAGTKGDLRQAELNLKIAKLELKQLANQITNTQRSQIADLTELKLKIKIEKKNIKEAVRKLNLAKTRADRAGVITWINDHIGATVAKGEVIAKIADLRTYKVSGSISDIHASKFQIDNPVRVRVNDTDLAGRIINIKPTIRNSIIEFDVELNDNKFGGLRSNMKVDIFIITSSKTNTLKMKNCMNINGSGYNELFVLKDNKAVRRQVNIGLTNFDNAEILSGIAEGEIVIISDMKDYLHMEEVEIE